MVILAKNSVFSLLFLVMSFIVSALLLFLLECEFLALLFILVYVGAIAIGRHLTVKKCGIWFYFLNCISSIDADSIVESKIELNYNLFDNCAVSKNISIMCSCVGFHTCLTFQMDKWKIINLFVFESILVFQKFTGKSVYSPSYSLFLCETIKTIVFYSYILRLNFWSIRMFYHRCKNKSIPFQKLKVIQRQLIIIFYSVSIFFSETINFKNRNDHKFILYKNIIFNGDTMKIRMSHVKLTKHFKSVVPSKILYVWN